MVDVSNSRTSERLDQILAKSQHSNLLIHIGSAHLPVFKDDYEPSTDAAMSDRLIDSKRKYFEILIKGIPTQPNSCSAEEAVKIAQECRLGICYIGRAQQRHYEVLMAGEPTSPEWWDAAKAVEVAKTYKLGRECKMAALKRVIDLCSGDSFLCNKVEKYQAQLKAMNK